MHMHMRRVKHYEDLSPFIMSTNIFVQSAVQTHLQNLHLADPLIRGRITDLDKGCWLDIRMPSRLPALVEVRGRLTVSTRVF
jgi:hypothetical protein